jgi:dihydrofolate synthase/folylpolyglutamate synthase
MNYQEALDYLYSQLPMYQRIGAAAYKADLSNTLELCKSLGNPELKFKSIHIAGTNGKGSVSHFIASILQSAGLKVGLYTSPHLKDFRERIKINGKMISQEKVIQFIHQNKQKLDAIQPSFFEYTFGMAIEYFANENVDIAVMETGMGGRLDSTNVVNSIVSAITNIGLDHTQFLGNTLDKIAKEKAGIIKKGVPVVIGQTQAETKEIFRNTALQHKSDIYFADQNFQFLNLRKKQSSGYGFVMDIQLNNKPYLKNLICPVGGNYQLKNTLTSLQLIETLRAQNFIITSQNILDGFENVRINTGIAGRWQIIGEKPFCICDTAHNVDGIKEVVEQIRSLEYSNLHFVLGMVNDKNISTILSLLPKHATYYFCKANIPRGLDQADLMQMANKFNLKGDAYPSVKTAYLKAQKRADQNDLIFIGGSTFVVAEVV